MKHLCQTLHNYYIVLFFPVLMIIFGCTKNNVLPETDRKISDKGLFILNEGNYGSGNASLSYYERDSFRVTNDIFLSVNNIPIGDVPQSMIIKDSLAYLTVSNSGKILVFSIFDFKHKGTIGGLFAPRYMLFINDSLMLVSDLYKRSIDVVNFRSLKIVNTIPVGGAVEQMLMHRNCIYAASWSFNDKLYKISLADMRVTDSLATGLQPNSMVIDKQKNIWVLCDGGYPGNDAGHEKARLLRIEPASFEIISDFEFSDLSSSPTELSINSAEDTLYFIGGSWGMEGSGMNGIFRMPIT
ncbi:MAG: YncE family protein, partial [Bacteroidota bacterium]